MERSTKNFINNESNFRVDEDKKIIYISAIFDWYENDFIDWLKIEYPQINEPTILDYIKIFLKGSFNSEWYNFEIEVNDYDWSLNE